MATQNIWSNFLAMTDVLADNDLYEVRTENTDTGKVVYLGKSMTPNASTSERIWFIKKIIYDDNGFYTRTQLPDDGLGFRYSWDDRATYFS